MGEKKKQAQAGGHQALYRKYRSKNLDEIVGQEHITKTLENALKQGKVNHAYLFTGPRGTGKTSVARILAHEINNLPYQDEQPHLDIIEIDAASNRRIDDIRDLRDKVQIAPVSAKYKVYIIDEVHMLTTESFNALLKTLEEPPAHVVFILATTEVHKLPATIISRTQRHSFRFISEDKIIKHLEEIAKKEGVAIEDEAVRLLARHGGGSFRDSISLLDQMAAGTDTITAKLVELSLGLAPEGSIASLLSAAASGNSKEVIALLEGLLESGLTPGAIAAQLIQLIRSQAKKEGLSLQTVQLMNELLAVHNAQYPELKLETALLKLNPSEMSPPPKEQTLPMPTTPKDEKASKKPPLSTKNEKEEKPSSPRAPKKSLETRSDSQTTTSETLDIDKHWPAVLARVKEQNNPLYTVLRLAVPEVDSEGLLLAFSFPFHQKKVEEKQYKAFIAKTLQETVGVSLPVRSVVDKSKAKAAAPSPSQPKDPAHASLITNVQDIMGGGEVVNIET